MATGGGSRVLTNESALEQMLTAQADPVRILNPFDAGFDDVMVLQRGTYLVADFPEPNIGLPLESILMEGCSLPDESRIRAGRQPGIEIMISAQLPLPSHCALKPRIGRSDAAIGDYLY